MRLRRSTGTHAATVVRLTTGRLFQARPCTLAGILVNETFVCDCWIRVALRTFAG